MASGSDLRLQVILQAIDRATAPFKRVTDSSSKTARALRDARDKLKELNTQQKAVGEFRELRGGLKDTALRLGEAQGRVNDMARALQAVGPPSKAMTRDFAAAKREAAALTTQHQRQAERVQALRDKLTAAGISTSSLGGHERRLRGDIEATTRSITSQTAQLRAQGAEQRRVAQLRERHAKAMLHTGVAAGAGLAMQAAGSRAVRGLMAPSAAFSSHEDAMLGIARQVPGARGELGQLTPVYRAIEQQIRDMSGQIPIATTNIAEMVTAAARMEVPTEQLAEFTRTAAMMATAFDAVPDVITEAMGKVAKNFKIPLTQIEGLADSINYLDDNAISKGADIIDFLNRTSGVVSTVAMSARDAAALGSTLLTLGERTETAGTAANAMVQKFAAASKGTKKFQSAVAEIGLNSAAIQKGMATDATGTLMGVIEAIRKLPKDKQIGVMVELVGMEHSDTLAKLVDKPEELRRQLELANGAGAKGSMRREFSARTDTQSAQWQMTQNRMFNASATMGETLKPVLVDLMNTVAPLLERFTAWVQQHQALAGWVLKLALGISALVAVMGAVLLVLGLVVGKMMLTRFLFARLATMVVPFAGPILGALVTGLKLAGGAVMFVGKALLMNPIGLAITGIAIAALLIYRYWGPITAFFGRMWEGVKLSFTSALAWVGGLVTAFYNAGANIIQGMANGIVAGMSAVREAVTGAAGAALGWFKEKLGIQSPSRVFMEAGTEIGNGAALGISSRQGYVRQAALGVATAAATVLPMAAGAGGMPRIDSRAPISASAAPAAAASGDTISITINAAPGMDAQAIARAVSAELDRRQHAKSAARRSQLSDID